MLEELELPYEIVRYERDPRTMLAPPALHKVHPLGKSPVITDTENGRTVAETGAIVQYLVERSGGRLGPPTGAEADYQFWLHYAEGSMMPPLLLRLVMAKVPVMGRFAVKRIQPMIDVHLDFVEAELSRRSFFAGDRLSGADIMMSFPLEAARSRAGLDETRPATIGWLDRMHRRPAYRAGLERGGPYAYA